MHLCAHDYFSIKLGVFSLGQKPEDEFSGALQSSAFS